MSKLIVIICLGGILGVILVACSEQKKTTLLTVRLGVAQQPSSALIQIALAKNFFLEEGLNVQVSYYPSGKRALVEGLLSDKADYISCSDIPFVWQSFVHNDLMILASIYSADNINRIISRNDAGIKTLADLGGKKIATQKQSAVHFFLHSVLSENKLSHDSIIFYKAEQLPQKLATAEIDAFSMREPFISQAVKLLGEDKTTVFSAPGLYFQSDFLISRNRYLENHPKISQSLLRALIKAEYFAQKYPEQAIDIVTTALAADRNRIASLWDSFELSVQLEHSLLTRLEHHALWMIEENLVKQKQLPNFQKQIFDQPLLQVKPEAMLMFQ